jgi:hypothetical protein
MDILRHFSISSRAKWVEKGEKKMIFFKIKKSKENKQYLNS